MKELFNQLFRFSKYMDMDVIVPAREKQRNPTIKLDKKLTIAISVSLLSLFRPLLNQRRNHSQNWFHRRFLIN